MSYTLPCKKVRETDAAILVTDTDTGENIWFPLSQTESMHFDKNGNGEIVVSDWIADQKGLE